MYAVSLWVAKSAQKYKHSSNLSPMHRTKWILILIKHIRNAKYKESLERERKKWWKKSIVISWTSDTVNFTIFFVFVLHHRNDTINCVHWFSLIFCTQLIPMWMGLIVHCATAATTSNDMFVICVWRLFFFLCFTYSAFAKLFDTIKF